MPEDPGDPCAGFRTLLADLSTRLAAVQSERDDLGLELRGAGASDATIWADPRYSALERRANHLSAEMSRVTAQLAECEQIQAQATPAAAPPIEDFVPTEAPAEPPVAVESLVGDLADAHGVTRNQRLLVAGVVLAVVGLVAVAGVVAVRGGPAPMPRDSGAGAGSASPLTADGSMGLDNTCQPNELLRIGFTISGARPGDTAVLALTGPGVPGSASAPIGPDGRLSLSLPVSGSGAWTAQVVRAGGRSPVGGNSLHASATCG